jgi:hypothetical protein
MVEKRVSKVTLSTAAVPSGCVAGTGARAAAWRPGAGLRLQPVATNASSSAQATTPSILRTMCACLACPDDRGRVANLRAFM